MKGAEKVEVARRRVCYSSDNTKHEPVQCHFERREREEKRRELPKAAAPMGLPGKADREDTGRSLRVEAACNFLRAARITLLRNCLGEMAQGREGMSK